MAGFETILYERQGAVTVITLNRPERLNAVNAVMKGELRRAWADFNEDKEAVVALLTGAGERAFCAGADLKQAAERGFEAGQTSWVTPLDCGVTKPVICAVNGVCAGGAMGFVAESDIVLCSENASFTDGRVSSGVPSIVGTIRLARRLPLETVLRMALMGRGQRLTAEQALNAGLVGQVMPQPELMDAALDMAARLTQNSPAAMAVTKQAILDSLNCGLDEAIRRSWDAIHGYHGHPDLTEGPQAFAGKREPKWAPYL